MQSTKETIIASAITALVGFAGGIVAVDDVSLIDIAKLEEAYYAQHGQYLQVLPGNKLREGMKGNVSQLLGRNLPAGFSINVYGNDKGQGYEIIQSTDEGNVIYSAGNEGAARTGVFLKDQPIASST